VFSRGFSHDVASAPRDVSPRIQVRPCSRRGLVNPCHLHHPAGRILVRSAPSTRIFPSARTFPFSAAARLILERNREIGVSASRREAGVAENPRHHRGRPQRRAGNRQLRLSVFGRNADSAKQPLANAASTDARGIAGGRMLGNAARRTPLPPTSLFVRGPTFPRSSAMRECLRSAFIGVRRPGNRGAHSDAGVHPSFTGIRTNSMPSAPRAFDPRWAPNSLRAPPPPFAHFLVAVYRNALRNNS